ncbi:hypothetical protein ACUX5Q_24640, partial [Salmonella enterica]
MFVLDFVVVKEFVRNTQPKIEMKTKNNQTTQNTTHPPPTPPTHNPTQTTPTPTTPPRSALISV